MSKAVTRCCLSFALGLSAIGCCCPGPVSEIPLIDNHATARIAPEVDRMLAAADPALKPLASMNNEQKQAVLVALAVMDRLSAYEASMIAKDQALIQRWQASVGRRIPGVGRVLQHGPRWGCSDANIAYASGMASCLSDENKSEEDCERENAGKAAAVIQCMMREIEDLTGILPEIPGIIDPRITNPGGTDPRDPRRDPGRDR
mgnify:CR=1 FL=1